MQTTRMVRARLNAKHVKVADKHSTAFVYVYTKAGHPCAKAYEGRRVLPTWHLSFDSESRREAFVLKFFQERRRLESEKKAQAAWEHSYIKGSLFRHPCGWMIVVDEVAGKDLWLRVLRTVPGTNLPLLRENIPDWYRALNADAPGFFYQTTEGDRFRKRAYPEGIKFWDGVAVPYTPPPANVVSLDDFRSAG